MSLKSRENRIYVLINVIERVKFVTSLLSSTKSRDKYNLYSTNIVFDRNGCIISRYVCGKSLNDEIFLSRGRN